MSVKKKYGILTFVDAIVRYTFRGRQTGFKKACLCDREAKKRRRTDGFSFKACDIGWNHNTSEYERKIHMQRRLKLYKWHCMIKTGKSFEKATTIYRERMD